MNIPDLLQETHAFVVGFMRCQISTGSAVWHHLSMAF